MQNKHACEEMAHFYFVYKPPYKLHAHPEGLFDMQFETFDLFNTFFLIQPCFEQHVLLEYGDIDLFPLDWA